MLSFGTNPGSRCQANSSSLPDYLPEDDEDEPQVSDKVSAGYEHVFWIGQTEKH